MQQNQQRLQLSYQNYKNRHKKISLQENLYYRDAENGGDRDSWRRWKGNSPRNRPGAFLVVEGKKENHFYPTYMPRIQQRLQLLHQNYKKKHKNIRSRHNRYCRDNEKCRRKR